MKDPEWTPGSSYLQSKLKNSNTADYIAYRLRSRLVSRSERETETGKGRAETVGSPRSEHTTVNTKGKRRLAKLNLWQVIRII